jgi:oligopeptide/dipeptide ABC transporter ATP-binding protein
LAPLVEVRDLSIAYLSSSETVRAVRNVSLELCEGETLALVGETGSGKSTLALALPGLLDRRARVESGEILFEGRSLRSLKSRERNGILSRRIGVVFQDARGSLNPVLSIGDHLTETLRAHQKLSRRAARERALQLLGEVGIPRGRERLFPFELSGGACQRAGIALAICNNPRLLVADEPTSAVDVTIQEQILGLLGVMKQRYGLALFLISHDLPLIAQVADRIIVMYHGRAVESGSRREVLANAAHPYTRGLIQSQPDLQHHHETRPLTAIPGALPVAGEEAPGCAFAPRCGWADERCKESVPAARARSLTHWAACIRDLSRDHD